MNESDTLARVTPVYAKLKNLYLTTDLVKEGRAVAAIVTSASGVYDRLASRIQEAAEKRAGVSIPILKDGDPGAGVPIRGNLIGLGNRSTNRTIEALYNRYFTLLDLRYPGPGGHEVRSLHNPFGGGHNVIFVGGSDAEGVTRATDVFVEKLTQAEGEKGSLCVGRLMEIGLGRGVDPPKDLDAFQIWEASDAYGSKGNFGWNSLSKRMAMYFMTGDPFHAREFVRLAFPDEGAKEEIYAHDDERIENKDEPLSGPYHYGAYTLILYWDLIEESPVFTDEERLRITNAFSKQFAHPQEWGWRREIAEKLVGRGGLSGREWSAGDRHGVWQFVALYCLARYFQKDYDDPLWPACIEAVEAYFDPLHRPEDLRTAYEHLYWYVTGITPAIIYVLLSGDRRPVENGSLGALLRGQEILISGRKPDWSLRSAPVGFLHQAAYLTQEGRWLEYLRRTEVDLSPFRLGQSFWPEDRLQARLPEDLTGRWTVQPMPAPMWRERSSGLPLDKSFLVGSFRSTADASGDFILIKGWNGAGRNPFHTFGLLELRLAGKTVLEGFFNQVMTRSDGMVEAEVGMDAALRRCDVLGGTAVAVGETPKAAFCSWRRTIVQRVGRYALIADDLAFRTGGENVEVDVVWQRKASRADRGLVREGEDARAIRRPTGGWLAGEGKGMVRVDETGTAAEIRLSDPYETVVDGGRARMTWIGPVAAGERRLLFSTIVMNPEGSTACLRLAGNAAALGLPGPAVVVAGEYEGISGELVVLAGDHLFGLGVGHAALEGSLLSASLPADVDWDFAKGMLHLVTRGETRVSLVLEAGGLRPGEASGLKSQVVDGRTVLTLPAGRHCLEGARPDGEALKRVAGRLGELLETGRRGRRQAEDSNRPISVPKTESAPPAFSVNVGGEVTDLTIIPTSEGPRVCAAEGNTVHVMTGEGKEALTLRTDGPIRVLRWWVEHDLLLVGCADEKVIAFDLSGSQRWTFVSEMDPEVFRAAKTYWFKSAPGHEGIHGLYTGVFLDGKSQAFVGSACTLEILDEGGGLVKRLPVFWGPGSTFALMDERDGSVDLLLTRRPADTHAPTVLNSRDLDRRESRYRGVPPGHTAVEPWGSLVRKHIFCEDLDGDGNLEVVSDINGTWNRVTVWAKDGTPLYSASFGPAKSEVPITSRSLDNMRDLDLADLDGDGKKEILAATFDGMVVALNHRCEKVWTRRMPNPPTVLVCVRSGKGNRVVVGCENGTLAALDGRGEVVGLTSARGRPTTIAVLEGTVVVGTDVGQVLRWEV